MDGRDTTGGRWQLPDCTEVRELGTGASGRVVLAVHEPTGTHVAVKYLEGSLTGDGAFRHAFREEARVLGELRSPHITNLYEYIEGPQGAAIVMEPVHGVSLGALLRQEGPTGPEAALLILRGSLLGLATAHRAGIVHRDYKPANVLVTTEGVSRLVDFGIAARSGSTPQVAGTPLYMAPEQWNGDPASPATDVYAATATFFECLTGERPYAGGSYPELAVKHLTAPVPEDRVPEAVRGLLRHGMAKDPEDRPADAEAFVRELEEAARKGYGEDWAERGRGRLATLVAMLPLLVPVPGSPGVPARQRATTVLAEQPQPAPPSRPGHKPGVRVLPAAVSALVVAGLLALAAVPQSDGDASPAASEAEATTEATPWGDGEMVEEPPDTEDSDGASDAPGEDENDGEGEGGSDTGGEDPGEETTGDRTGEGTGDGTPGDTGDGGDPAPGRPGGTDGGPGDPPPGDEPPPEAPPATVQSLGLRNLVQSGSRATAELEIHTSGTGPVTVPVSWHAGWTEGSLGPQDGNTEHVPLSGKSHYVVVVEHTFQKENVNVCYWAVAATAGREAGGQQWQQIVTQYCTIH
ncbi:hypothetical protein GCM10009716_20380 [Streptomyces sodiiphilus]|uniref:Protein kinase domain-containing protein n=1 Tax=Streptomyces sodiiphilus TaxID=226217 RepID=A0ABN2P365_9ACTN